jgi:acyl carrier protein
MTVEERVLKLIAQAARTDAAKMNRDTEYVKDLNIVKSVAYFQLATMLEAELNIKVNFLKLRTKTVGETIDYIRTLVSP